MGFFSRLFSDQQTEIDNLKYQVAKAEEKLKLIPKPTQKGKTAYDDTHSYIEPIKYNEQLILDYIERSALIKSIHGVLIKECTKDNWEIKPMFNYKCINEKCSKEYDQLPENEICYCGEDLREPNIEHQNILKNFIDNPNNYYDFYEIVRSCLSWELKLDRYYVYISHFSKNENGENEYSELPLGLFVEDPRIIRIKNTKDKFCPICYKPDVVYKDYDNCPKCGFELWETFYIKLKSPNSEEIIARYRKEEMIEGHYYRELPDLYGTPPLFSAIKQMQALIGLDNLNSDIFVKRKLNKIMVFPGATQAQVDEVQKNIEEKISYGTKLRKFLFDIYLGVTGSTDIKVYDALPDAEKLQSLEWYKFYREIIASIFEVPPVFSGVIESGKAGANPNLQDVVMGSTKRARIRTIEEPFNSKLMPALQVTDYYIAFPEFTLRDAIKDATVQKLKAETAEIFLRAGFAVEYIDGELSVSRESKQIEEREIIDVESIVEDDDTLEKFEKILKKKTLFLKH